jgi:hypothetical protein
MAEPGLSVDHVTIWRWIQRNAPVLSRRIRREICRPNRSWRVDETYVKVAGSWAYLYRAVNSAGETIEFMLSPKRAATKLFLRLALSGGRPQPRLINVDGHPAYARAVAELKQAGELGRRCRCRMAPLLKQHHRAGSSVHLSGLPRASVSGRWRAPIAPSRATSRCMPYAKVRSAGLPRAMPWPNVTSSIRSSAMPNSDPTKCPSVPSSMLSH